jgi:PAS domain S-box-containing protein
MPKGSPVHPPATPPEGFQPEDRFRLLVESVQDYAIFMLDPTGHVLTWNAGAQRLKGYEAAEIIGRSFETFYPREAVERGWPQEELRRATAQGRFEDEGWRVRKDGSTFWASVVITALRDEQGRLIGFGKVTRDLTDRKRHEEALRHSEEQLRLLMESVQDYAIYMLDPQGRVLTWNAGARAIKGYTAEEVVGRHFSIFFTAPDLAAGAPSRELDAARRSGRAETEGWRVRKDGTLFWASIVITPVHDDAGVLRGFAKVTRDLTEQRRIQELEHSSRRMHEFLAMLAHELRNPLAPIRNASEIMQRIPELPAPLVRVRQIIDRQLRHLTRLIDDLLDVARIVNGKIVLRTAPVDYRDIVHAGIDAIRPLMDSRQQRLDVELPPGPLAMTADATRLAQSLHNLLSNASRYTPEGGAIRVAVRVEGTACVTEVRDTGQGIAAEALERIFGLFEQEVTPHGHGESGLGIGLPLARKLVELHGGMLSAASPGLGQGSTFTMLLPLRSGPGQPPQPEEPAACDDLATGSRVLVVDDNRDSADTMVSLLELMGHEARAVYGALDAPGAARDFQPRVVLLDLNMPDGDGYSVLQRLRERTQAPMFVAAMTGYGQDMDRQRTRLAGFQAHLTKPVGIEELQRVLREAAGP